MLEQQRDYSRLKHKSQMDLRKTKLKEDRASQREQQELLESEQSFEFKGDPNALLFPLGISAAKRQQEA